MPDEERAETGQPAPERSAPERTLPVPPCWPANAPGPLAVQGVDVLARALQDLAALIGAGEPCHVLIEWRAVRAELRVNAVSAPREAPEAWQRLPEAETGEVAGKQPQFTEDFRWCRWPEVGEFTFSPKQALVVRALWEARGRGLPHVPQTELLRKAGSDMSSGKLRELFCRSGKAHPAWGRMILQSDEVPGAYLLPPDGSRDGPGDGREDE